MAMYDEAGIEVANELHNNLNFDLAAGREAGKISLAFAQTGPIFRRVVAIEIDAPAIHSLIRREPIDVQAWDEQPRTKFFASRLRVDKPLERVFGESHALGLITVHAPDEQDRAGSLEILKVLRRHEFDGCVARGFFPTWPMSLCGQKGTCGRPGLNRGTSDWRIAAFIHKSILRIPCRTCRAALTCKAMSKHEKSPHKASTAQDASTASSPGGGNKSQTAFTPLTAIILAAGKGTRMKSPLPKVLHPVAGLPMVMRVMTAARDAGCRELRLVVGHGEALVRKVVEPLGGICFQQKKQRGTADAVRAADVDSIEGLVLVLCGDAPLVTADDLKALVQEFKEKRLDVAVVTSRLKRPGSLGRIVRQPLGSAQGPLRAIVEASDASAETLRVREVNSGAYIMKAERLRELLPRIDNKNSKGEFYFTDVISLALDAGHKVDALPTRAVVAFGVNSQAELAVASRVIFNRNRQRLMADGVVMLDPSTVYAEDDVQIGSATVVYPNVLLRGRTKIGAYCVLEPGTHIISSALGDGVHVKSGCYIDHAVLENRVSIGPYAHLRPETTLREEAHVGNFVEMKKTDFGARSKAGHLTYLGDATIGKDVNIGCGTITCNYAPDRKKYRTVIGDGSFIGSDVQFVAPVQVGSQATIASGSTITADVPDRALAIARGRQVNKTEWSPKHDVTSSAAAPSSATSSSDERKS